MQLQNPLCLAIYSLALQVCIALGGKRYPWREFHEAGNSNSFRYKGALNMQSHAGLLSHAFHPSLPEAQSHQNQSPHLHKLKGQTSCRRHLLSRSSWLCGALHDQEWEECGSSISHLQTSQDKHQDRTWTMWVTFLQPFIQTRQTCFLFALR